MNSICSHNVTKVSKDISGIFRSADRLEFEKEGPIRHRMYVIHQLHWFNTKSAKGVPEETLVLDYASPRWTRARLRANDLEITQLPPEAYKIVIKSIEECLGNIREVQQRSSDYYVQLGIEYPPHHRRQIKD